MAKKKLPSEKLAGQLDKLVRAIKDEIVIYIQKHGVGGYLEMPDGRPYKSVTIDGYSYDIDNVRMEWWKTDYRISIDSHGLNYSCTSTDELLELLEALEETFNE